MKSFTETTNLPDVISERKVKAVSYQSEVSVIEDHPSCSFFNSHVIMIGCHLKWTLVAHFPPNHDIPLIFFLPHFQKNY